MPAGPTLAQDKALRRQMVDLVVNRALNGVLDEMPCEVATSWLDGGVVHVQDALRASLNPRSQLLQAPPDDPSGNHLGQHIDVAA